MPDVVDQDEPIGFAIAMQQPNMNGLQKLLTNTLSNVHMSFVDAALLGAPRDDDVDNVKAWLASHGIQDVTHKGDWIKVRTTVGTAQHLLDTTLNKYAFEDQEPVIRTTEYHIPDELEDAIRFVHPVANFMRPKHDVGGFTWLDQSTFARQEAPPCTQITTPQCIRDTYNIHYEAPNGEPATLLGIAGFLDQYANYEDSDTFIKQHLPEADAKGYNYTVELVHGGENPQVLSKSGHEAALDVDLALALAYPANLTYYSTGGRGVLLGPDGKAVPESMSTNEPYVELLQYFLDKPNEEIPSVLSVSYADDEQSVPRPYAEKVCEMIGVLSARGMTVVIAGGDGGSMGGRPSNCTSNDGNNKKMTIPTFPSTCPYVLVAGAVTNSQDPAPGADFSSGGFSNYFKRPAWQDQAVEAYIKTLDGKLDGYYDPGMRAFPDISAVGTNVLVQAGGRPAVLQGTSASAPIIASMLALVNDARARKGKKSLGYVNELMYSDKVRATLRDVTDGESLSCTFDGKKVGGWPATEGWDAITGLGVPGDFADFMQVLVDA
jgi:tripeptidyl-peptidase-1